jgi:ribosomal-protein-alanine N-acetyltransferase
MNKPLETNRLHLRSLQTEDYSFIKTLVNTEGWITFIGDRKVLTDEDSKNYIQKIIHNKNITYWVVSLKENDTPVGLVTFIKRDYLEFPDLGFAFLPEHGKKGYAFEAANCIVEKLKSDRIHQNILATTIPENSKSIALLKKLGYQYKEEIFQDNETLHVYLKVI